MMLPPNLMIEKLAGNLDENDSSPANGPFFH